MLRREYVISLLALAIIAVVANEAALILCGPAPSIYNNVLTFMGPLRVDPRSFAVTSAEALASLFCRL